MKATFAGGCFWCIEAAFDKVKGVSSVTSGYTGGTKADPSYLEVSSGKTGHLEAVQLEYDPKVVSYSELLDIFWHNIDPTDEKGQFNDKGYQYKTAIFCHNEKQLREAQKSKEELVKKFGKVATEIHTASAFYRAEEHHQKYHKKCPIRYNLYKLASNRNRRLKDVWNSS